MSNYEVRAERVISDYMIDPEQALDAYGASDIMDAFMYKKFPIPRTLGDAQARDLQRQLPPGYTAIVEPYLGRWRAIVVKEKHAKAWAERPPNEHD